MALGVLIFQDLMVVPIVIAVGLLGGGSRDAIGGGGRPRRHRDRGAADADHPARPDYLVGPLLKAAASTGSRELIVAIALFLAVGTAVVTSSAGLSTALGAFLAGLLLGETANTATRSRSTSSRSRACSSALFFMTVGMSLDLGTLRGERRRSLADRLRRAAGGEGAWPPSRLSRALRMPTPVAAETAILLAGAGEFGFVVFTLAAATACSPADRRRRRPAAGLSMIATPALAAIRAAASATLAGSAAH